MLMNDPDKFQRVAREWAIKHAGAPKTTKWSEEKATQPTKSLPKTQRSREEEARALAVRYVYHKLPILFLRVGALIGRQQRGEGYSNPGMG
jgi:ubiquitin-conjugating enzyme (huntingtin interacting protein 2)